ncbi:hypothetical protein [Lagierella sp.]|uniref:hypothetical protein n=1 Tax=Lagierella sp. TaxID=2849657 RepID=UPI002634BC03|nr:hypothetical protein [Lagierella sp.]
MTKKAYIIPLLLSMCLIFVACDNKNSEKSTENEVTEITDISETTESSEPTKESSDVIETDETETSEGTQDSVNDAENNLQNDGNYFSSIIASKKGEFDNLNTSVYEAKSDGETLKVSGSLSFGQEDYTTSEDEILENKTYTFEVDENTEYKAVGGLNEPQVMTVEEFNDYFMEVKESGLGLIIKVENGVATEVEISS